MKPFLPLLAVSALLLAACVSPLPLQGLWATATPTLTPTPTRTPTPTLTPTPTITPTPSLPPEALTRLAGRDWRIEGDKVMAGDVAWYTLSSEGWQPAQFVVDFDKYYLSLDGLEIANEDGVVRIYDPNASDERARLVYEDGKVNILFAVERAKKICVPTKFKPMSLGGKNNYWVEQGYNTRFLEYFVDLMVRAGLFYKYTGGDNEHISTILIDSNSNGVDYCWGFVYQEDDLLFFPTKDNGGQGIAIIKLMQNWYDLWFK